MQIKVLESFDEDVVNAIIKIHRSSLPEDFLCLLDESLLRKYYSNCLKDNGSSLIICENLDEVMGFVLINYNETILQKFILNNFLYIFKFYLKRLFNFYLIYRTIEVIIFALISSNLKLPETELAYICVAKNNKGKGFGSILLSNLDKILVSKKIKTIWVKTLQKTPHNIEFYKENNFCVFKYYIGRCFLTKEIQ